MCLIRETVAIAEPIGRARMVIDGGI